ncbi:hypothetical protein HHI36_008570, partial [Cryptolaemus montrouzieri]
MDDLISANRELKRGLESSKKVNQELIDQKQKSQKQSQEMKLNMENNTLKETNHILESKLAEDGKLLDQQNQELIKLKEEQRTLKQENLSLKKEVDHFKNQTHKEDNMRPSIHACKGDMNKRSMSLEKELQNIKQILQKQHMENAKKEISDANREVRPTYANILKNKEEHVLMIHPKKGNQN